MAFQELFTVIDDGETQHPRVHYVFSDDEEPTHLLLDESPNHRIIIYDYEQAKVESLASDWQAIKAEVTQAPSWGDQAVSGMMLKITGKDQAKSVAAEASFQDLLLEFDKGMELLEEVLADEVAEG